MPTTNILLGLASAIGVIAIWSGFIVFSRAGVHTNLTAYDISALRFMVAGVVVVPFAWTWWPRHLPLRAQLIMSACGPGATYALLMYLGLGKASAAYAGMFANGSLPIFTAVPGWVISRKAPGRHQLFAISVIVIGGLLLGWRGAQTGGENVTSGIALFLSSSAILSVYIYGVKHWQIAPRQALALVTVPNALLYVPLWFFFLPSGMADTNSSTIVFQALYQGLGPGFLAIILFALEVKHLGPTQTAGFSASVPATATLLAIPVLSEVPNSLEWTGIAIVTTGLGLLLARST